MIDHIRKSPKLNISLDDETKFLEILEDHPSPEEHLILKQDNDTLIKAIAKLREPYQKIIELRYIEDKTYKEIKMPGACPAAKVSVKEIKTGKKISGWVCCGNYAQLYMPLNINDTYSLVMTRPEAKRYASDIVVISESGEKKSAILEVNKPLKMGSWTIYQYGYDTDAGKASMYSSFELVYDPWLNAVYFGIILCAIGSLCLFWIGNKKRKDAKND